MPRKKQEMDLLPEFYIKVDEDDPKSGIQFVSLVVDPAIDIKGMYFNKQQNFEFKVVKEQMKVVGPAMIPEKRILRRDPDGREYNVVFTNETIRTMVNKFNRNNNNKSINIDHTNKLADAYIQQNWIVEDPVYDKSKMYGYTLAPGTWFIEVKIEDPKFWEDTKEVGRYSFSIEGLMGMSPYRMSLQPGSIDNLSYPGSDFVDKLTDKEVINLVEGIVGYRVSFDFDGVLSTDKGQKMAKKEIDNGNDVFIVTKRNKIEQSKEVYEVADKLGIPRQNVHFTNTAWKYKMLNNLNVDIHYDDQQIELDKIKRHTNILAKIFK